MYLCKSRTYKKEQFASDFLELNLGQNLDGNKGIESTDRRKEGPWRG